MVVVRCMDPMPASRKAGYSRRGALREVRRLTACEYCRHKRARSGWRVCEHSGSTAGV